MNNHGFRKLARRFLRDDSGQDIAEYAVLIALVALAVVTSVIILGDSIANTFNDIGTSMNAADLAS